MGEFIGSHIQLVSKSDIRYVGILHQINSDNSTIALEQVKSHGTEDRRTNPDESIPPSDTVYEYIVFRGSDVKDLSVVEPPKENRPPPAQVPNDPAILGGGARPQGPATQSQPPQPPQNSGPQSNAQQQGAFSQQFGRFPSQNPYPPGAPQPGFGGPPRGFSGYPGMPYGPGPGFFPPPGQGFSQPPGMGPSPHQQPLSFAGPGPTQQQSRPPPQQPPQQQPLQPQQQTPHQTQPEKPAGQGQPAELSKTILQKQASENLPPQPPKAEAQKSQGPTQRPASGAQGPPPPIESKPDVTAATAPGLGNSKNAAAGQRSGRVLPAVPLPHPAKNATKATPKPEQEPPAVESKGEPKPPQTATNAAMQYQNATTQAATAAVAAAMAKLAPSTNQQPTNQQHTNQQHTNQQHTNQQSTNQQPTKPSTGNYAMDNLTQRVNEMRTNENNRAGQPGAGPAPRGRATSRSRGRGGGRGGRGIDVPKSDFDFESANARFNKQDLSKDATAGGSPAGIPTDGEAHATNGNTPDRDAVDEDVVIPTAAAYDSKASFFDNISSDIKDREEGADGKRRPTGYEFRNEERKRNMETFGMGSVDGGYRGGFRGRGRGRGYRGSGPGYGRGGTYSGRGGNGRGNSVNLGGNMSAPAAAQ
ncbi:MAG: hypothetical protein M1831_006157 [Alyxoria varia]|nr:MAG: hypothetical protein M1831_006157 [Alyxoria varia]